MGNWIAVYSGTQPSMEDYIANYESLYSFTGSELLQVVLLHDINYNPVFGNPSINIVTALSFDIVTDPDVLGYTQGLYSVRAGEGTWATIRNKSLSFDDELEGYFTLSEFSVQNLFDNSYDAIIYNTIIVPVSDLTGTGVIKFYSTLFSHPDIDQEDRALDLSIIARCN